ncbi:hypothetical protein T11_2452 [Trichinella zimbabwensis]|uniref:Uncharacterized protein n=1 Tax=Trichinella zimbabwensis TaxID=268475 RepID=A0A0V1GXC1_9BILA|nr:hypothetical protein T11_2452 [Trichinella zimbabwensis]
MECSGSEPTILSYATDTDNHGELTTRRVELDPNDRSAIISGSTADTVDDQVYDLEFQNRHRSLLLYLPQPRQISCSVLSLNRA